MLHTEKLKQRLTCATYVHMRDACVHKKACHMCAFSCMLYMRSGMYATHELCTLLLACCMPVARFNFCVCGTQALWYISACLPGRCGTCAACLPGRCGTCAASLPGRCLVGVVHVLHVCLVDVGTLPSL